MAQVAQATIQNSLSKRLNAARDDFIAKGSVSPLFFNSLEGDIKKLIQVDGANGYDLLSQLYVFKNDVNAVRAAFENSVRLDKSLILSRLLNYHASLMIITRHASKPELFEEAESVLMQAYELGKNIYSSSSSILYAKLFGYQYFDKALEVADMIQLATINNPIPNIVNSHSLINQIVHKSNLPIEHCSTLYKMLFQFLTNKGVKFKTDCVIWRIDKYHDYGHLQFLIGLDNQTPEQLVALQWEFDYLRAEYDIENNVNTLDLMYEIVTEEEVIAFSAADTSTLAH